MASCAGATATGAIRVAGPLAGCEVLIVGAGALGLAAAAFARRARADRVVLCDPSPDARQRAGRFGFDATESATPRSADVVLEMAGTPDSVCAAFQALRLGGTLVLVGTVRPIPAVEFEPERIVTECLTIRGLHNYHPADLDVAVDGLAELTDQYPWEELFGPVFLLEHIEDGFAAAHAMPGRRVACQPFSESEVNHVNRR